MSNLKTNAKYSYSLGNSFFAVMGFMEATISVQKKFGDLGDT
jgi:hypothetical protein